MTTIARITALFVGILMFIAVPIAEAGSSSQPKRPSAGGATSAIRASRSPAGVFTGSGEAKKPLLVQGQSRNFSMMMVSKGDKEKVKFGEVRQSYKREIMKTNY